MDRLAIILINYRQPEFTIECIESILKSDIQPERIIVVDNGSGDDSVNILSKVEEIVLIQSRENVGFAAGNNIGIRYAIENGCEAVMLLNNDTIIDHSLISELSREYDGSSVLVPKMYYYDEPDKMWYAGGYIDYKKAKAIHEGFNKEDYKDSDHEFDFATGCCLMIPTSIIKDVGFLDERFFMYCEDMDYSLRLKKCKIKMKYVPDAKLWHKVGGSTSKKSPLNAYYDTRNRLIIIKEHNFSIIAKIYFYSTRFVRIIQSKIKRDGLDKYIIRGIRDFHSGITGKAKNLFN